MAQSFQQKLYLTLPHSSLQFLSQELAAAQKQLLRYTDLISDLYAELETIRGIVCYRCKEKISLATHPAEHKVPIGAAVHTPPSDISPSQDGHPSKMSLPATDSTTSHLASLTAIPDVPSPSTITLAPPKAPPAKFLEETAVMTKPIIEMLPPWSVTYNSEIRRALDISFVHAFKHASSANVVRFSHDGNFVAAGLTYNLGKTQIYDVQTRSMTCSLAEHSDKKTPFPCRVWDVCFTPDNRFLVVVGAYRMICIWEIKNRRLRAVFKGHTDSARSLDVSPSGYHFVTCSYDGSVRIWNSRDGSSKQLISGDGLFESVRFSPNGRYVVASDINQLLRIWHVRSGNLVGKCDWPGETMRCVAFTPDGEGLVSGGGHGWHGKMKWAVSSVKPPVRRSGSSTEEPICQDSLLIQKNERLSFQGHSGEVRSIAISADGKWVITGSSDKCVRVWDTHTALQHCTLEGHKDVLWSVGFSPVGNYIATGSNDGFVTLWRYRAVEDPTDEL